MAYFIKKIFQNKTDESVHAQFVRFSKGIFENKAVLNLSITSKVKFSGTCELANDLVIFASSISKKLKVSGIVMSRNPISGLTGTTKKGLCVYNVDEEMDAAKLREIATNSYASLLDCTGDGIEIAIKKKLPRPSSKGADKVNDKFCTAGFDLKFWQQAKEFFILDVPEGKKYRSLCKYEIKEIILPPNEKDYEKIRIMAKRKGILSCATIVDGKEVVLSTEFAA